ncbi:Glycerophosphocholine phosphodiesterase [Massospora cicadina]|nr:Glycerophosphocholine phosphodiesterase [Massospora cicadina]
MTGLETFQGKLDQELTKIESFILHKSSEALTRLSKISHLRQNYLAQSFNAATNFPDIDIEKTTKTNSQVSKGVEIKLTEPQSINDGCVTKRGVEKYSSHFKIAHLVHLQKTLLSALLAIKYQFFQLVQFKEINYRGVVKIAKKADKLLGCDAKQVYLEMKNVEFPNLFSNTFQAHCQQVIDLADSIQQDLQKTLRFFDPTSEEYAAYGEVLLEKHKLLMNILGEDKILLEAMEGSDEASLFQKKVERPGVHHLLLETNSWLLEVRDVDERSIFHKIALFGCSKSQSAEQPEALEPPLSAYPGFKHYLSNNFLNSSSYSPLRFDLTTTSGISNYLADNTQVTGEDSERVLETILHTIQRVNPSLQFKVMDIDVFGRRPTHYAALNNFPKLYTSIARFSENNRAAEMSELWYDLDGCSPLFYAILRGHAEVVEAIMQLFPNSINLTLTTSDQSIQSPLGLAASLGYPHLIQLLMRAGVNPFGTNESGETALHIAARNGFDDCVRELLLGAATEASLLANLKEYYAGYTALMLAATEGHANICDQLLAAGADPTIEDKWGWRAYEHAISNGFIPICKALRVDDGDVVHHPGSPKPPRKLVSLVDTSSAAHLKEPLEFVDLPARGTQPIVIHTSPGAPVIVNFDIVSSVVFGGELLARGSWRVTARPTRARQCIALLRAPTMETVGHVNVEWILVTPFLHPHLQTPVSHDETLPVSTRVIGHRGMGANTRVAGASPLQVGENTVLSFITAASQGAEYVEFDVQVTRDGVPVVYHDFTVTESGYDIPMQALTHQQFLQIYSKVHKRSPMPTSPPALRRQRSNSVDVRPAAPQPQDHVLLRVKGNNPNTIQSPFVTLADTFRDVPCHVGFNIEVKYPMVDEAEAAGFHGSEMEINAFVDAILRVVGDHDLARPLMFSSFHPEICLLLSLKQARIPVFFLTDCGYNPVADYRCNSLRAATRFASAHNLTGLVVLADPLVSAPRLMSLVRDAGLACFTYGAVNNQVHVAQRQKAMGVDAVIVDSVATVSRSLKESSRPL